MTAQGRKMTDRGSRRLQRNVMRQAVRQLRRPVRRLRRSLKGRHRHHCRLQRGAAAGAAEWAMEGRTRKTAVARVGSQARDTIVSILAVVVPHRPNLLQGSEENPLAVSGAVVVAAGAEAAGGTPNSNPRSRTMSPLAQMAATAPVVL